MKNQFTEKIYLKVLFALLTAVCVMSTTAYSQTATALLPDVPYHKKAPRTYVFANAQLIYSLGEDDYYHHWNDRPLLVDPSYNANVMTASYTMTGDDIVPRPPLMSLPAYEAMQKTVTSYGMDGLSFMPNASRRMAFFDYTLKNNLAKKIDNFKLLPTLIAPQDGTIEEAIQKAIANPYSLRINNKVVFLAGSSAVTSASDLAKLKSTFGNIFYLLQPLQINNMATLLEHIRSGSLTAEEINAAKNDIRTAFNAADGIRAPSAMNFKDNERKFDAATYLTILRLIKSVYAEAEFNDKLLCLDAKIGHENNTRFGLTFDSDNTKTLRRTMEAALAVSPDIINIYEWDEQNENTSLRPTVYNSFTTKRIMRYYMSQIRQEQPTPLPGDNQHLPNLVISYRKTVAIGEKIEAELLNIPDTPSTEKYRVKLSLSDEHNKEIYSSAWQELNTQLLEDKTIVLPSENFATHRILIPRLLISYRGQEISVNEGLHYIDLRTSNWDYKRVEQPVRDLILPTSASFSLSPTSDTKLYTAKVSLSAKEPLRHVEILDNDDVVYSYCDAPQSWRDDPDNIVINLAWGGYGGSAINGSIALKNAVATWKFPHQLSIVPYLQNQTLYFHDIAATKRRRNILMAIPRKAVNNAVLDIHLKGIYEGQLKVRDIVDRQIYGIPGPRGLNIVFSHMLTAYQVPPVINKPAVSFTTLLQPRDINSVLHLQAIGMSGKTYRSEPIIINNNTTTAPLPVYSASLEQAITVQVPQSNLPRIAYKMDPQHGSVLIADAGRSYWSILGGYFGVATGRGGGNAGDDTPFIYGYAGRKLIPNNTTKTAPDWIKMDDGNYALQFDGKSTHISLPQSAIPRYSGYTIEMDIKPEDVNASQNLLNHGSYYTGSIRVYLSGGTIKIQYAGIYSGYTELTDTGLKVEPQKWSHLKIVFDQQQIQTYLNGTAGKPIKAAGPGIYDTATSIGGYSQSWYHGLMKNIRIIHGGVPPRNIAQN